MLMAFTYVQKQWHVAIRCVDAYLHSLLRLHTMVLGTSIFHLTTTRHRIFRFTAAAVTTTTTTTTTTTHLVIDNEEYIFVYSCGFLFNSLISPIFLSCTFDLLLSCHSSLLTLLVVVVHVEMLVFGIFPRRAWFSRRHWNFWQIN